MFQFTIFFSLIYINIETLILVFLSAKAINLSKKFRILNRRFKLYNKIFFKILNNKYNLIEIIKKFLL